MALIRTILISSAILSISSTNAQTTGAPSEEDRSLGRRYVQCTVFSLQSDELAKTDRSAYFGGFLRYFGGRALALLGQDATKAAMQVEISPKSNSFLQDVNSMGRTSAIKKWNDLCLELLTKTQTSMQPKMVAYNKANPSTPTILKSRPTWLEVGKQEGGGDIFRVEGRPSVDPAAYSFEADNASDPLVMQWLPNGRLAWISGPGVIIRTDINVGI